MSSEVSKPSVAKHWIAQGPGVIHYGITDTDQVTTTGLPTFDYFDDEQGLLDALGGAGLPALPAEGEEVFEGEVYDLAGTPYLARQSHIRTSHDPSIIPALFSAVRTPGDYQDWIVQEQVTVGDRRDYSGTTYECVQSHQTQVDWTPDLTPALWSVFTAPKAGQWAPRLTVNVNDQLEYQGITYIALQAHTTQIGWEPPNVPALWSVFGGGGGGSEWQANTAYSVNDEVTYLSNTYRCIQAHTSQIGWEPPNVPALWSLV